MSNPIHPEFRNDLPESYKAADVLQQYRLFSKISPTAQADAAEVVYFVWINGKSITKVIIDPHYERKRNGSVNDEVILELIQQLSGSRFEPEAVTGRFQYFVSDNLFVGKK